MFEVHNGVGAALSQPDLQDIIDGLLARNEDLPHAVAGLREDMLTPAALASDLDTLQAWLDVQGIAAEGMDQRTRAAYLIGGIAFSVCTWLAVLELTDSPRMRRVGMRLERYWWHGEESSHEYVRFPLCIEAEPGPADYRTMLEECFAPLIAAIMVTSGLSAGAQWRLVSDSVAQGFLYVGSELGMAEKAMEIANGIIAEGRMHNGKTCFVEIPFSRSRHWFVSRGGCCRYYTTTGGEYCSSCVLRKRDDQVRRYRDYYESVQAAE